MEGYGQFSQERTQQMRCVTKQDWGRKKTRLPKTAKGTTVKIIQLFEDDPSFSGISGGIDSGKSLLC